MNASLLRTTTLAITCIGLELAGQNAVNFESGPVHALDLSDDGSRLFVANTIGGRLSVFDTSNPDQPLLRREIPVGLEPVSVHARTRDEVWVCNLLSDSVSIVSLSAGRVVATLRVIDEPSDIVFAAGKAFVTAATTDRVQVFDAVLRTPIGTIDLFGKDPRALAVSPNETKVYAVIQRSGNGTTILPASIAPPPPPPSGAGLPTAPDQGIIVRWDDPQWSGQIPYSLPDHDVAEIDVATLTVARYFDSVGTTNTGIAVDANTGDLWVANTDARNLVRFEPQLRGHAIDSRVTKITTGTTATVTAFDLNPGINYAQLPNNGARATALSEPFGVAFDASQGVVFVAAQGTDRIAVVDSQGAVIDRIEIGDAIGAQVDTRNKRGPRALALHATANRLYVLNRLSDTLSIIDTVTHAVLNELPIASWDAMPTHLREGRKFLYDAKLSGNGTMSCAACHIDGDTDGISWDLGDPGGTMQNAPMQSSPFNIGLASVHPMKGAMMTQTLRGLANTGVLHWRGDRADFQAFNPSFDALLGGAQISSADMNEFAAFIDTVVHPPNPNQLLDRSLRTTPANNNEAAGQLAFIQTIPSFPLHGGASCTTCHDMPTGTNGLIISKTLLQTEQQLKIPQLRNLYRKLGFLRVPGPQKSGFGFAHDGSNDTLHSFLIRPVFSLWPAANKDDLATFLMSFDTGTAPAVGYQFSLAQGNAGSAEVLADLALLTTRATAGDLDLTAHGRIDGVRTSLLYEPVSSQFISEQPGVPSLTAPQLLAKASSNTAALVFTGVPPGSGQRIALDRDLDGIANGSEAPITYGIATPGCVGSAELTSNSEPRLGNELFGFAIDNAPGNSIGVIGLSFSTATLPLLGIQLLIDPITAVPILLSSDAAGESGYALPIPTTPGNVGLHIYAQTLWLDACGSQSWSSSAGIDVEIRP